jgi:RNA polymerase sigma factor (sigma-70 family)
MAEKLKKTRTAKARGAGKANKQEKETETEKEQTFAEWLCDREPKIPQRALTDAEAEVLDRGYRTCLKRACAVAARITGCTRREAEDIVHGAIARIIRGAVTGRVAFPDAEESFRRRLMGSVRCLAKQVIAAPRPRPPLRKHGARCVPYSRRLMIWREQEQLISRRKVPERGLSPDMEGYDNEVNGPPAEEVEGVPWSAPRRTTARHGPRWPKPDPMQLAWDLSSIFDVVGYSLSPMQRQVMELVRDGMSREEIAETLEISPKTVDTHEARAMQTLHDIIMRGLPWSPPDGPDSPYKRHRSEWNSIIRRLEALRLERLAAEINDKAA